MLEFLRELVPGPQRANRGGDHEQPRAEITPGLYGFHGGLVLDEYKQPACDLPIAEMPLVDEYWLPLHMHIGTPAIPVVSVGDKVARGQLIARPDDFVSAAIHAPTSGTIRAIEPNPFPHPGGLSAPSIILAADGQDTPAEPLPPWPDYQEKSPNQIRTRLRDAGIVGLGGAVFPTAVKMAVKKPGSIETLVLNGAECEPYISCDDRLMQEQPDQILAGARVVMRALGSGRCLIGIEDNKPHAVEAMRAAVARLPANAGSFAVMVVPTVYPAGGEKQLLRNLTGVEVPRGQHATDYGMLCLNVGTAANARLAVVEGKSLIERVVTVTGGGVAHPQNFRVRIGTPMYQVIAAAGGYARGVDRLLMGGPMMGFALEHDHIPVVKATNCLLALRPEDRDRPPEPQPCIRCSRCADHCPADLLPQQLYWHARSEQFERAVDHHLFDCIECGVCSAVCPSHIPLVQYFRFAKTETWADQREKAKAEHARRRFEFHNERIERQKAEREAALAKKRAQIKAAQAKKEAAAQTEEDQPASGSEQPTEDKKTAKPAAKANSLDIQAARERARARKEKAQQRRAQQAEQPTQPNNTETEQERQ